MSLSHTVVRQRKSTSDTDTEWYCVGNNFSVYNLQMVIAIIGTGDMGSVLGMRWAMLGHKIQFGSRAPDSEHVHALLTEIGSNAVAMLPSEAATNAEVVVLAIPRKALESTAKDVGCLKGKIIIDPINPLNEDLTSLTMGTTTSLGEVTASLFPDSFVIKAFNMTGVRNNVVNPVYGDQKLSMMICGDSQHAKSIATGLINELDFETVDCGPITSARYLEPMAMLWIILAVKMQTADVGFRVVTR